MIWWRYSIKRFVARINRLDVQGSHRPVGWVSKMGGFVAV
jgi:hypothetical protein